MIHAHASLCYSEVLLLEESRSLTCLSTGLAQKSRTESHFDVFHALKLRNFSK